MTDFCHNVFVVKENYKLLVREHENPPAKRPTKRLSPTFHSNSSYVISLHDDDFATNSSIIEIRFFATEFHKDEDVSFWVYSGKSAQSAPKPYEFLSCRRDKNKILIEHTKFLGRDVSIFYGVLINDGGYKTYVDPELIITKDTGPLHDYPNDQDKV